MPHRAARLRVARQGHGRSGGVPGSDVDLLIVLSAWDRPFLDRIATFLPGAFPGGVDVFPCTRAELRRMTHDGHSLVTAALGEGRTIFLREPGASVQPGQRTADTGR